MKCSDEKIYELAWRNYSKLYKEQYGVEPDSKRKSEFIRICKLGKKLQERDLH